jgi:hypothetical protein
MKKPPDPKHIDQVKQLAVVALKMTASSHLFSHLEIAMGLALVMAEELYHDGAGEQDAKAVMTAAWRRVAQIHKDGGCKGVG